MALALTPFTALCGFRPLAAISRFLASTPELAQFTTITPDVLSAFASPDSPGAKAALRTAFEDVAGAPEHVFKPALARLVARYAAGDVADDEGEIKDLVLSLHDQFPDDIGIFCAFFLNRVFLEPGEAIFLGAGEPHAYVSGGSLSPRFFRKRSDPRA
jgi:mannose-6-phosphate isomerase